MGARAISAFSTVLVLVLLLQLIVVFPTQVNRVAAEAQVPAGPMASDLAQRMRDVHLVETIAGIRHWELWSAEASAYRDQALWSIQGVKAVFFARDGVEFTVTGERGKIETERKNLAIEGRVVTRSSNGYVFRSEKISYDAATRNLLAPGPIEMDGPKDDRGHRLRLVGEDMMASMNESEMKVLKGVRAERVFPPDRLGVIRSDGAQFSAKSRRVVFQGSVIMDLDDMRVTGPEAEFEYVSGEDVVRSIHVKGGARISDTEKWATAQDLRIQLKDDRVVLRGNPRVVQGSDELRGEEIVFLDGGRRIMVQRARAKVDEKTVERVN